MKTRSRTLEDIVTSRYWRRSDAEVVVKTWLESGETLGGFARRWALNARRIARWASEFEEEGEEQLDVTFHPLRVVEPEEVVVEGACVVENQRWLAELEREQWTVRVPVGFDASEMERLLHIVTEVER